MSCTKTSVSIYYLSTFNTLILKVFEYTKEFDKCNTMNVLLIVLFLEFLASADQYIDSE